MKKEITFGGIAVESGCKKSGFATVPGTDYRFPITVVNGKDDGKAFFASAGIHGAEYPGIKSLVELSLELDPKQVSGAIVLVHCCNVEGLYQRQSYVMPNDPERKNLNRLFPGNAAGTLAEKFCAYFTNEFAARCDFHVDLHSGDIVENLQDCILIGNAPDPAVKAIASEAANYTSFQYRMNSGGRTECYNSTAINKGNPSILFERGGHGDCSQEEVDANKNDLKSIMQYLKILPGTPHDNSSNQVFFKKHEWTEAGAAGILKTFVKVGDDIKEGQKLAEIYDLFGNLLEVDTAKFDGHVVILASTSGINKGDDLITYGC